MTEYQELREKAINERTPEALAELGEWFEREGGRYWNGEVFDADGYSLKPIYELDEFGDGTLVGWELY